MVIAPYLLVILAWGSTYGSQPAVSGLPFATLAACEAARDAVSAAAQRRFMGNQQKYAAQWHGETQQTVCVATGASK